MIHVPPEELSPRVVPRDSPRVANAESIAGAVHAEVIRWRDLVLAAWELRENEQYTGELPAGLSSQQFWAKVTRAAKGMGGKVGIAVRGQRWWVWAVKRGRLLERNTKWAGLWTALRDGGRAQLTGKLTPRQWQNLKTVARRRKGMRIAMRELDGVMTIWEERES